MPDCEIIIGTMDDFFTDVQEGIHELKAKKKTIKKDRLYFSSVQDMQKCISEKRIELLKIVRHQSPGSLYELAKLAKRKFEPVKKDVKILENAGLMQINKTNDRKKRKIPICNVKRIIIPL